VTPFLLLPFLAFVQPANAAAVGAPGALPGGGGIRIDGSLIPADEVWGEYAYLTRMREFIHPKPTGVIDAEVFRTATEQILRRHLLAREAARRGIELSPEERAGLREKQVSGWKGEANFQRALSMLGVTEAFILSRMEMNQLSRKMVERDLAARPTPPEEDLAAFYKGNLPRYLGDKTALRYVLLPAGWSNKQVAGVAAEAEVLLKDMRDYASLVQRFSIHGSAASGGVVAEGDVGSWPHPDLAKSLQPGRLSRERRDEAGVHFYARDNRLPLPLDAIRGRVAADLHEALVAEGLRAAQERLREASRIEYLEGVAPASLTTPPKGHH
jgi:hypothetical protein